MGFFDKLKALGDPRHGIDSIIETQARVVESLRSQYPNRDMNAWLAQALASRPGFRGKDERSYLNQTAVFAAARPGLAAHGLGLMVALDEATAAGIPGTVLAPYDALFGRILSAVLNAPRETLLDRWADLNPWTAEHFPDVKSHLEEVHRLWLRGTMLGQ